MSDKLRTTADGIAARIVSTTVASSPASLSGASSRGPTATGSPVALSLEQAFYRQLREKPRPTPSRRRLGESLLNVTPGDWHDFTAHETQHCLSIDSALLHVRLRPSGRELTLFDLGEQTSHACKLGPRQRRKQRLNRLPNAKNPGLILFENRGSFFLHMVETVGIEPTSATAYGWLLRA
jgi:hypothetical protein